jgi:hypothetical protein
MNWHSYYTNGPNKRRRKAIPATCGLHRGPIGFANLLVSMQDGTIVLDPHVTGRRRARCASGDLAHSCRGWGGSKRF